MYKALLLLALLSAPSCAGRADLTLDPSLDIQNCPTSESDRLTLQVINQGRSPSKATTTGLRYGNRPLVELPTPSLRPGESGRLSFGLPDDCLWSTCSFEVHTDLKDEVAESDEANNSLRGQCDRAGRLESHRQ